MNQGESQFGTQEKVLLGVAVVLLVVLVGGIVYYVTGGKEQAAPQQEPVRTETTTSTSVPEASDTNTTSAPPAPQNTANSAEFDNLIGEKDRIDTQIGETANAINSYLSSHSSFRGASELKARASALEEQARNAKARASQASADPVARDALVRLFQLEIDRVHGLYKGMVDNTNGGDYSNGFQDGTRASYAFDEANKTFNQTYKK